MNSADLNKMNNIINSINQNNNVKNIKSKEGLFERTKVIHCGNPGVFCHKSGKIVSRNTYNAKCGILTEDNKMLLKD